MQIYLKYKIFLIQKYKFFVLKFFKSRLCSIINLDFLQFLFISAKKIHITNKSMKYKIFQIKKLKKILAKKIVCRLCSLINFFLFNSENISFYHRTVQHQIFYFRFFVFLYFNFYCFHYLNRSYGLFVLVKTLFFLPCVPDFTGFWGI